MQGNDDSVMPRAVTLPVAYSAAQIRLVGFFGGVKWAAVNLVPCVPGPSSIYIALRGGGRNHLLVVRLNQDAREGPTRLLDWTESGEDQPNNVYHLIPHTSIAPNATCSYIYTKRGKL